LTPSVIPKSSAFTINRFTIVLAGAGSTWSPHHR
jgi:hypothetical protein